MEKEFLKELESLAKRWPRETGSLIAIATQDNIALGVIVGREDNLIHALQSNSSNVEDLKRLLKAADKANAENKCNSDLCQLMGRDRSREFKNPKHSVSVQVIGGEGIEGLADAIKSAVEAGLNNLDDAKSSPSPN